MKITIVESGHIGLVTEAYSSQAGINVMCVDIERNKIDKLNEVIIPNLLAWLVNMSIRNMKRAIVFCYTHSRSLS